MRSFQIGVMQGRLLPKYMGRYQAHPVGYWQREFHIAKELGLDLIEFILDFNDIDKNPMMNESGLDEIRSLSVETGIGVKSVCADYFMEAPLHSSSEFVVSQSQKILERLIETAAVLGVRDIVIPCVDAASLLDEKTIKRFVGNIRPVLKSAEQHGVNLSLETDLSPKPFADLLKALDSPSATVNYDTGNSASLGYDPEEELGAYGGRISDIHIKDRVRGRGSVVLGEGSVDFHKFFSALKKADYSGPFIMQAYRDEEGVEIFKRQLEWIKPLFNKYLQEEQNG